MCVVCIFGLIINYVIYRVNREWDAEIFCDIKEINIPIFSYIVFIEHIKYEWNSGLQLFSFGNGKNMANE